MLVTVLAAGCRASDGTSADPSGTNARPASPAAEPTACEETCNEPVAASAPATSAHEPFPGCQEGCGTHLPFTEEQVKRQPGAANGDFARCPVSRVVFVVDGAKPTRNVDGKDVYFCCTPCAERFSQAPDQYKSQLSL